MEKPPNLSTEEEPEEVLLSEVPPEYWWIDAPGIKGGRLLRFGEEMLGDEF